jgi:hypothetical protein
MDITPSIPNPNCRFGGELVPDKTLKVWKASNPKGYKRLFEVRAKLAPVIRICKHVALDSARASVEPYPIQARPRAALGDHHDAGLA